MATIPYTSGSAELARRFLAGQLPRIAWFGDSVSLALAHAPYQAFSRLGSLRGYGQGQRWSSGATLGTCFTGDATVNDFADPLDFGGWVGQVDFGGGTSDASSTSSANRMLYLGQFGPHSGIMNAAYSDAPRQKFALGQDWWANTLGAGREITIKVPVYKHSGGPVNADMQLRLINGSTQVAVSSFFSGYAATPRWEYVTITIPTNAVTAYTWLQLELRFRASTASENGKKTYVSARVSVVDETITTNCQEFHMFAQGGATIGDYNNLATWSDTSLSVLGLIRPDVMIICLGLNDSSGGSAATFSTNLQTLVARFRAVCPGVPVIYTSPHARISLGSTYGGEGSDPYYADGAYRAQQATSNSLFVNLARMLPNAGILTGIGNAVHSSYATGEIIFKSDVVESSGTLYAAKGDHYRIATAPGSDATNWQSVSSIGTALPNEARADRKNFMLKGDGLHQHMSGSYMLVQTFVNGVMIAAAQGDAATIAAAVRAELADELSGLPNDGSLVALEQTLDDLDTKVGEPNTETIATDIVIAANAAAAALAQATAAAGSASAANAAVNSITHGNAALKTLVDGKASQASVDAANEAIDDLPTAVASAAQPRINEPPAKAYTLKVSAKTDGTLECPDPLRLAPGATNIPFGIDMSPLYGQVRVLNVGEPTISGGDVTVTELGPHDWIAMAQTGGTVTAGEKRIITVPVTMRTGETEQVRVKVFGMTPAE